jgi:hypothetical protein
MQCITFRRFFPSERIRRTESCTFPIETDAHRTALVDFIIDRLKSDDSFEKFIDGRLDVTWLWIRLNDKCYSKRCVQIWQGDFLAQSEEDKSITFCIDNITEKLAFANFVIENKLGDFRGKNTQIYVSDLHEPNVLELSDAHVTQTTV